MITDANGMPVLQPLVDDASTATFNAAFAQIGTVVGGQQIKTYKWANAAARTAQTGMSTNDVGIQADTLDLYRYSGTAWVLAGSWYKNSASVTSSIITAGSVSREGTNADLYITRAAAGSALSAGSVIATLPSWAAPATRSMLSGFGGSNTFSGWVNTDGTVQVYGQGVAGYTGGFYFGGSYHIR